jgi:hypothetical protein
LKASNFNVNCKTANSCREPVGIAVIVASPTIYCISSVPVPISATLHEVPNLTSFIKERFAVLPPEFDKPSGLMREMYSNVTNLD